MRKKYANIIVDISHANLNKVFQYAIPEVLDDKIDIGMMVKIPFGNGNRLITGYVIGLNNQSVIEKSKIKYIDNIVGEKLALETQMIKLAVWMQEKYACTIQSALKCMLPSDKEINTRQDAGIKLLISKDELNTYLENWSKKNYKALVRAGRYLLKYPLTQRSKLSKGANITAGVINNLEKKHIIRIITDNEAEKSQHPSHIDNNIQLNPSQIHGIKTVVDSYGSDEHCVFLLHGVTGSGKTEVYLRIIEQVIKKGQQAIVLVPEISLTPQTVKRFKDRFGSLVGVIHSRLSKGEKFDEWMKAKNNQIAIMVGARSAIFAPFNNLGIIVIDEEHEMTYKSEISPKYHARDVAIKRAQSNGAKVVLGSATPSLESYYKAKTGEYYLLELKNKAVKADNLDVEVVDMRQELTEGNKSIFSRRLMELMQNRLLKKEQIILFLNRRGHSKFVSCRKCGYVFKCKHCDISYTYHRNNNQLVCHYCGHSRPLTSTCPACGSKYIKQFGIGTQKVEEYVKKVFPEARVLRMDLDTTTKKDSFSKMVHQFANHEADILIGTQMIAKGHDFERVTLVGVLAADLSLHNNDFRAAERTFQLVTQVSGRAGRSHLPGAAVIQTYSPEHYSIIRASNQDYTSFYDEEITFRKIMHYPPYSHFMTLLMQSSNEKLLINKSYDIGAVIKSMLGEDFEIIGPSPASISKIRDNYRQRIIIKHNQYDALIRFIKAFYNRIGNNNEFKSIAIQFDINPLVSY